VAAESCVVKVRKAYFESAFQISALNKAVTGKEELSVTFSAPRGNLICNNGYYYSRKLPF
jgi:hypothetical protein